MATYPIKNLGELGVIADLAPTDLPPNAFTDALNARFVENRVFKTGGCAPVSYTDEDESMKPLSLLSMPFDFYSNGESFNVVGTADKLYKLTNGSLTDISHNIPTVTKKAIIKVNIHPKVQSISLNQSSGQLQAGHSLALSASIVPDTARSKKLKWVSSDPSQLTVVPSADTLHATLKAIGNSGNVTVTISTDDDAVNVSFPVQLLGATTGVILNKSTSVIRKGATDTIVATVLPNTVANKNITWTSSNNAIALVSPSPGDSKTATITGVNTGMATLTAISVADNTKVATCAVQVIPLVDSILLDTTSRIIETGSSFVIKSMFNPDDTIAEQGVTWTVDLPAIAQILPVGKECTVKGLVAGTATITATSVEGNRKATCTVQVVTAGFQPITLHDEPEDAIEFSASVVYGEEVFDDYEEFDDAPGMAPPPPVAASASTSTPKVSSRAISPPAPPPVARASAKSTVPLTGLLVSMADVDIDVGDTVTINSIVNPLNADQLVYSWKVDRPGVVSASETTKEDFKITALNPTYSGPAGNSVSKPLVVTLTVEQKVKGLYDASPEYPWYHAVIANCAVATTYNEIPQVKVFNKEDFDDLPGWGIQTIVDDDGNASTHKFEWKCERVRAFNNRLFALNMREASSSGYVTHYPLRMRWSNFANENEAPTLWDDYAYERNDVSDLSAGLIGQIDALENGYAGYIDLADSNGNLIDMLPLRDYLFVYTEFETYVGTPTMNSYQPLMWKKLFNDSGILAPDCVCEVEGGHFVVTQNDIILHNGTSKKSLASNRVKDKIINEVCAVNPMATKVHLHQDKKEVWILYVGPGQEKLSWACTKAAVWNYEYDTWSFRTIPYSYDIALIDPPTLERGPTWEDMQIFTWDVSLSPKVRKLVWKKNQTNFHRRMTVVASAFNSMLPAGQHDSAFYQMDYGPYDYYYDRLNDKVAQQPLRMWLERSGIDFDNATEEWNQKHVNAFRPQVSGSGRYTFIVGGTQYSNEIGHRHSIKDYQVGKDRLVCVRLNHPYLFYNVIDNDIDSNASMNAITIEYSVGGRR